MLVEARLLNMGEATASDGLFWPIDGLIRGPTFDYDLRLGGVGDVRCFFQPLEPVLQLSGVELQEHLWHHLQRRHHPKSGRSKHVGCTTLRGLPGWDDFARDGRGL